MSLPVLIAVVALLPVVLLIVMVVILRRWKASVQDDPRFAGCIETAMGRYGGGADDGMGLVTGNGVLGLRQAMHGGGLVFVMLAPRRALEIPGASIRSVRLERTLRVPGRYQRGRIPWIMVEWVNPQGRVATSGFQVRDFERWQAELQRAVPGAPGAPGVPG